MPRKMREKSRDKSHETSRAKQQKLDLSPETTPWSLVDRVLASAHARTLYLWGPPGVGKSFVATREGLAGRSVAAITLTPETPSAEIRGGWMPKGSGFEWRDGPVVTAMREGGRVVLNEVSYASSDVLAFLHPVLESPETARLTLPSGESVVPAPGFQVVGTDNCSLDQLPEALQDRFRSVLKVEGPHPDALARLRPELREAALRTYDLEPERAISIRGWLAVQDFESELGAEQACQVVFGRERGEQVYKALRLAAA
ncbi:MAG: AAA family ATPase [bacterium]|nr:AAA family ATPase [bacterium]